MASGLELRHRGPFLFLPFVFGFVLSQLTRVLPLAYLSGTGLGRGSVVATASCCPSGSQPLSLSYLLVKLKFTALKAKPRG